MTKITSTACGLIITFTLVTALNVFVAQALMSGRLLNPELWTWVSIAVSAAVILLCIIVSIVKVSKFKRNVMRPLLDVSNAIGCLTAGKPTDGVDFHSDDEIGYLTDSINVLVERMSTDIAFFGRLKEGDYSQDLPEAPRTDLNAEGDQLKGVIQAMIESQRELIRSLKRVSRQIADASTEIAGGSQNLASGSNEQAAAIEEFSVTVDDLRKHAEGNAALAHEVVESIKEYSSIVSAIGSDMKLMTDKMNDISESSMRISSVSDIVENIAFQTNILALNAAVEAARAGHNGRGFAVVADEVRQLSSKSATAAREAADLIKSAIENVNIGSEIAENAASGMAKVEGIAKENEARMSKLSEASLDQSRAIGEMSSSINQISQIVQANSALAEESASASQELSTQSKVLDSLVGFYTIDATDADASEPPSPNKEP